MMIAVSRRSVKSGRGAGGEQGAQLLSRQHRGFRVAGQRGSDPCGGIALGLALGLEPAGEVPHAWEPRSGGAARSCLTDVDEPATHVVSVQLDWADIGVLFSEPVGEAPHGGRYTLTVFSA